MNSLLLWICRLASSLFISLTCSICPWKAQFWRQDCHHGILTFDRIVLVASTPGLPCSSVWSLTSCLCILDLCRVPSTVSRRLCQTSPTSTSALLTEPRDHLSSWNHRRQWSLCCRLRTAPSSRCNHTPNRTSAPDQDPRPCKSIPCSVLDWLCKRWLPPRRTQAEPLWWRHPCLEA